MPIYEYQCQSCEHQLEALQKMSDEPLTKCPACQQETLKKLVSAAGFRLKGGGWYETDFKKSGDKKKNLVGETTSPAGGSTATTASGSGSTGATSGAASSGTATNNSSATKTTAKAD